jgi:hypothetical protein
MVLHVFGRFLQGYTYGCHIIVKFEGVRDMETKYKTQLIIKVTLLSFVILRFLLANSLAAEMENQDNRMPRVSGRRQLKQLSIL